MPPHVVVQGGYNCADALQRRLAIEQQNRYDNHQDYLDDPAKPTTFWLGWLHPHHLLCWSVIAREAPLPEPLSIAPAEE